MPMPNADMIDQLPPGLRALLGFEEREDRDLRAEIMDEIEKVRGPFRGTDGDSLMACLMLDMIAQGVDGLYNLKDEDKPLSSTVSELYKEHADFWLDSLSKLSQIAEVRRMATTGKPKPE